MGCLVCAESVVLELLDRLLIWFLQVILLVFNVRLLSLNDRCTLQFTGGPPFYRVDGPVSA